MKRALSSIRENTPFASPPRVLVMAADGYAGEALNLADALDEIGAEAEVRFGSDFDSRHNPLAHCHPDAVIETGTWGYRVARHHPILEKFLPRFAGRVRS